MRIRPYGPGDLDALYAISIGTGHAGADASSLYSDPTLMGHIYAAPYALLEPSLALVAEDQDGAAGFIVGSLDTSAWETVLEREWWPSLRPRYADPDPSHRASWTADQRRAFMIHNPSRTPVSVVGRYPAHVHLNLLPRLQRRGVGPRLFEAWRAAAGSRLAGGMHVGVNRANAGAIRFWQAQGFEPLRLDDPVQGRTLWMGRPRSIRNPARTGQALIRAPCPASRPSIVTKCRR